MKLGSESMVRIWVLGGDSNGHAVASLAELSAWRAASTVGATLCGFETLIRTATTSRPYVHYDVQTGCVMSVSNDNAERCGLEVGRLSMPVRQVIEQWYASLPTHTQSDLILVLSNLCVLTSLRFRCHPSLALQAWTLPS
ncbi:hypothetical protein P0D69_22095 [Paraburkholderia sediminicola]|uniref:hypothetical protein n=1 Tax=Paraburkholderia sediminicola TaxID=458836 RepID=UPI0038BABC50